MKGHAKLLKDGQMAFKKDAGEQMKNSEYTCMLPSTLVIGSLSHLQLYPLLLQGVVGVDAVMLSYFYGIRHCSPVNGDLALSHGLHWILS